LRAAPPSVGRGICKAPFFRARQKKKTYFFLDAPRLRFVILKSKTNSNLRFSSRESVFSVHEVHFQFVSFFYFSPCFLFFFLFYATLVTEAAAPERIHCSQFLGAAEGTTFDSPERSTAAAVRVMIFCALTPVVKNDFQERILYPPKTSTKSLTTLLLFHEVKNFPRFSSFTNPLL